jgi:hypothetical protein
MDFLDEMKEQELEAKASKAEPQIPNIEQSDSELDD